MLSNPQSIQTILSKNGNVLVLGHDWYGWNDVNNISNFIKEYIKEYKIQKLNVFIACHGIIKENKFCIGLKYAPEETMGSPEFIESEIITRQLCELSELVFSTHIVSVACFGYNQTNDLSFKNFKNTIFYFFSNDSPTWQADLFHGNTDQFSEFYKQYN